MGSEKLTLPEPVNRILQGFVESARSALGNDLKAIVLYGSAAEGKLRKTSDVNVIVVLRRFEQANVDALREPLRTAHAAVELEAMFILEGEIRPAMEAFAVKFADILHRHRILYGDDPFVGIAPSRSAEITRLKQVLLNLILRLRHSYLLRSLRDEQMAVLVADTAGPLRVCAEALLELQGKPATSPKQALAEFAKSVPDDSWDEALRSISEARETGRLPPEVGVRAALRLLDLATHMYQAVERLN